MVVCVEVLKWVLSDPLEWLSAELDAIQTKETNCTLLGDADHEEFIVRSDLHVTNVLSHVGLAIVAKVDFPGVLFIVNVHVELLEADCHQKGLIILYAVQSDELGHGHVLTLRRLVGVSIELTIADTVSIDPA